jgi:hypothetical protein
MLSFFSLLAQKRRKKWKPAALAARTENIIAPLFALPLGKVADNVSHV